MLDVQKLLDLEAIFGTVKAAAKHYGVSPSTWGRYKRNPEKIPESFVKKINRSYGQQKKKLQQPEITERKEKQSIRRDRKLRKERKKELIQKAIKREDNILISPTVEWLNATIRDKKFFEKVSAMAFEYAAYTADNPARAQFIKTPTDPVGKNESRLYVQALGLFSRGSYFDEDDIDEEELNQEKAFYESVKLSLPGTMIMSLNETIQALDNAFMQGSYQFKSKTKHLPLRLIGFQTGSKGD